MSRGTFLKAVVVMAACAVLLPLVAQFPPPRINVKVGSEERQTRGIELLSGTGVVISMDCTQTPGYCSLTFNNTGSSGSGVIDYSGATRTVIARIVTSLPSSCTTGEWVFWNGAPGGRHVNVCVGSNTWMSLAPGYIESFTPSTIPANGNPGRLVVVTNAGSSCTTSGSNTVLCYDNGSSWLLVSGGGGGGTNTVNVKVGDVTQSASTIEFVPGTYTYLGLACSSGACSVTINGSGSAVPNEVNFSGANRTIVAKTGTSLPSTCQVGEWFFNTAAPIGRNVNVCIAANTWYTIAPEYIPSYTTTTLPSPGNADRVAIVTNAASSSSCTAGGGTTTLLCRDNGTQWVPVAGGGSGGGSSSFNWKPSSRYVFLKSEFHTQFGPSTNIVIGDYTYTRTNGTNNINNVSFNSGDPRYVLAALVRTLNTTNDIQRYATDIVANSIGAPGNNLYTRTDLQWEFVMIFRLPNTTDLTNVRMRVGMESSDTAHGIGVRYHSDADGSQFMYYATLSNNVTTLGSGVSVDNQWHRLRIRSDGAQQYRMWIQIDNAPERSICPSGCDLSWNGVNAATNVIPLPAFSIQTLEAANKNLMIEYVHFWLDTGAER